MANQTVGGYGKRPLWQWILLYVVIAAIAYGLIYYFFFSNNGGYNYSTSSYPTTSSMPETGTSTAPSMTTTPQNSPAPTNTTPAPSAPSTAITPPTTTAPAPESFTVSANDASATPENINVTQGAKVSITFQVQQNEVYHGGLDFRSSVVSSGTITPGNSKTVTFTAQNSFSFTPYWPSTNIAKPYTISVAVK